MTLSGRIFEFASKSITLAPIRRGGRGLAAMAVLGLSETPPATPSSRRRVDGVVHHAFHLADMYLTREANAYIYD